MVNKKDRLSNINDVFVFSKQCKQVYYTYIPSFRKDHNRVYWLSVVKTKPRSCVQVVKYGNDEVTTREYAFQMDELNDLYTVALFIELEENLFFHVVENTYVHINADELNELLSIIGHTKVDENEEIEQLKLNKKDDDDGCEDNVNEDSN